MMLKNIVSAIEENDYLSYEEYQARKKQLKVLGYEYAVLEQIANAITVAHVMSDFDVVQDFFSEMDEEEILYFKIEEL